MASWLCNATLSNVVSNALCTISCSNDSQTALPRREGKQNISEQVVVKRFSSRVGWLPSYLPPFIFWFFSNNSWLVVSSYQSSSKVSSCCSKFRFHPHHLSIFVCFLVGGTERSEEDCDGHTALWDVRVVWMMLLRLEWDDSDWVTLWSGLELLYRSRRRSNRAGSAVGVSTIVETNTIRILGMVLVVKLDSLVNVL